mgnify:CR=1 FL=1
MSELSPSIPLNAVPERHHWLNTIVGILDQAFHLTSEEQMYVIAAVDSILETLRIPDRSDCVVLPAPLALEIANKHFSNQMEGPLISGVCRPIRLAGTSDIVVSIETWREALVLLLTTAHEDITPVERMVTARAFVEILDAIGVPDRAAAFFPDDVVRLSRVMDAPTY